MAKYINEKGVYIEVETDKNGKDHINIYDKDPRSEHGSIHINWDSSTGKGNIVDTTNGDKETTDVSCFLTTACMRHMKENFDDNCYELDMLRWFRDNFVSKEDKKSYYEKAPIIVEKINSEDNSNEIYKNIYDNVISLCVRAIEYGKYDFAYETYKNCILDLENSYINIKQKVLCI